MFSGIRNLKRILRSPDTMNTPFEIYKLLNKSNCKKCLLPSCMAFSVAVVQGEKQLADCPDLSAQVIASCGAPAAPKKSIEDEQRITMNRLLEKMPEIDFSSVAKKLGGVVNGNKLAITCLGKDFIIDSSGAMTSECHCNQWVHLPLLGYIVNGQGKEISGEWLPYKQLDGAGPWSNFFSHRCIKDLQQLADAHTDLFFELLHLFNAKDVVASDADHCLVIHPLPKLPMMISYWLAEEGFPSKLSISFDKTAPKNLNVEYIYIITRGIVEMFRELIVKHNMTGKLF
jgi:hypothetical protein